MTVRRPGPAGFSLPEMLIVAALMGVLFIGVSRFFQQTSGGFANLGAGNSLKSAGQNAVNRIGRALVQNRRLFQRSDMNPGGYWWGRLPSDLTGSLPSWSQLPVINTNASLSPGAAGFVQSGVGNSLFFAKLEPAEDFQNILDPVSGQVRSVRVDMYRFYYYYVAENAAVQVANAPQRVLKEWRSILYADLTRIASMPSGPIRSQVVDGLLIRTSYAWDPSQNNSTNAFFQLSAGGGITSLPMHQTQGDPALGASANYANVYPSALGGYSTGVSPNTKDAANIVILPTMNPVPQFAAVSGSFPAGFETMAVGPSGSRSVYLRLVLIAKGGFKGYVTNEQVLLRSVRDIW